MTGENSRIFLCRHKFKDNKIILFMYVGLLGLRKLYILILLVIKL
jgi:hypothetical protein